VREHLLLRRWFSRVLAMCHDVQSTDRSYSDYYNDLMPLVRAEGLAAGDFTTPKSAKKDKRSRFLAWQKRLPADHPDKMSEEAIEKKLAWLDQKKKVSFAKSKSTPESVKPSQGSELNSQNTHSQISGTSERLNVVSVSTTQPEKDGQMLKDIGTAVLAVMASQKTGSSSN
jgi:ADP-heptose:LPS heptosyltransferase